MPELCDHYEGGDHCGALTERRYLPGFRCPDHTPAANAGRPENTPNPDNTTAGLRNRQLPTLNTQGDARYGPPGEPLPVKNRANPQRGR